MIRKLRAGINFWLFGLTAVASIPLFLFSAYLILEFGRVRQANDIRELSQRAEATASAVSQLLSATTGYLSTLAVTDAAQRDDIPALYSVAKRVVQSKPGLTAISLISPDNQMVFLTWVPLGTKGIPVGDIEAVRQVIETGRSVASGAFKAPVSTNIITAIGVPVFQNGKVAYCLRMIILTESLNKLLASQKLPVNWTSAIVDKKGTILARSHAPETFVGTKVTPTLLSAISSNQQGVFDSLNKEGVAVKTVLARVPGWDWSVVVGVPTESLNASLNHAMTLLIGFGLAIAGVGYALSIRLAGQITRQVKSLVIASDALLKGEHADMLGAPIIEFDDMAHQIEAVNKRENRTNMALKNVTARHEEVATALRSARRDPLTGLAGRDLFLEIVKGLQEAVVSHGDGMLALLFIDLDGFKRVNDSLGHAQGDKVLMQTADILRAMTRDSDAAGRLGGDEFVVCLTSDARQTDATAQDVAARVVKRVNEIGFGIGCSIGIAVLPAKCPDISCAMRRADEAMYEAKRTGKNKFVMFGAEKKADGTLWADSAPNGCSIECVSRPEAGLRRNF